VIPNDEPCTRRSELGRCSGTIRYDSDLSNQTAVDGVCDVCQSEYVHILGRWTPFPDDGGDAALVGAPTS
jgi:hypothetical protein